MQESNTCYKKKNRVQWFMSSLPALWEAELGYLFVTRSSILAQI